MSEHGGFDVPPMINAGAENSQLPAKWYARWYVWALPALVLLGALFIGSGV
ncbi:hypothetical protein HRU87_02020 [Aquiluna borgnonia]|jgi:hypothetical protein|uniref:Uncharacterized protein n=1 Tax=Aquiluna borgnonia TaxID=2499157 RepID=A0A7D4PQI1_9MICO|nr:hypothetical protein [Aquiluna borgnonia]QKJ25001.1 hypothetical protein HRU87_02020 [Aquiluna borgnonia]